MSWLGGGWGGVGRGEFLGKTLGMTLACPFWWWVTYPEIAELPGVGGAGGQGASYRTPLSEVRLKGGAS